ncbi:lipopolysaccharide assembly protein LapB [Wenyingzhuangia sp. 2_MG-2023]|uniref:tetratricopeptide repeat protein n=1 Tax=Wenyingzhuangia sp. 2_MG-2023 TaxID=3062639 RepID=UPI0026E47AEC|nr:hypothetical protein [Wenyingzhuangia sp. 2_MG-2023]MDO6737218.1 hypothetical protein [Wenyingzhuangia sp. 2_MG-2023]MDO6801704.1 hypothetical protein [Wenyingzhuangia sp. 1_MG-2023]
MKTKLTTLFTTVFSVFILTVQAQDDCALRYNMLKTDYKTKNYESALKNLDYCLDNCGKLTANIYIYGGNLIDAVLKTATPEKKTELFALGKKMFAKRFENFPDAYPAKAHSDYADFLKELGGDKDEIYNNYEQAFKMDPTKLGVGSIISYFNQVVERNKDSNLQVVFNTYDVTLEAINKKVEGYLADIAELQAKEEAGQTLLSSESRKLRAATLNSKALGQVEGALDQKIEEISTCQYLIPLYKQEYEANKNDKLWLHRAINRMYKKDCTEDPLYVTLVGQYQEIDPSPEASVLYAGILMDKGEVNKAVSYFEKAIEQETNADKKAKNLYKVADIFRKKGQNSKAVSYAKKAIAAKPNLGRAYTMIATLYASGANSCGSDEFEKRMAYVVAEQYALRGGKVDPSIGVYASKLARSYKANQPSKKLVFNNEGGYKSGDNYTIKCWINETVQVP